MNPTHAPKAQSSAPPPHSGQHGAQQQAVPQGTNLGNVPPGDPAVINGPRLAPQTDATAKGGGPDVKQPLNPHSIHSAMRVVSSDDRTIGTVDRVQAEGVRLTQDSSGDAYTFPLEWITSVEGGKVHVRQAAEEARQQFKKA